jgi:hypothetical protein
VITHDDTVPVPLASILHRWQTVWQRLYAAELHGLDAAPADLLAELHCGAHIADLVTDGRWLRVIALLRVTGIDSWPRIAEALNMPQADARDEFIRWATDQTHHHRATGRGLPAAQAQQWITLLGEASL